MAHFLRKIKINKYFYMNQGVLFNANLHPSHFFKDGFSTIFLTSLARWNWFILLVTDFLSTQGPVLAVYCMSIFCSVKTYSESWRQGKLTSLLILIFFFFFDIMQEKELLLFLVFSHQKNRICSTIYCHGC